MTQAAPTVKAPKTKLSATCARCGRKLKTGTAHTTTPLGTFGPECETYAAQAQMILHRAGLGTLATQGELRFPVIIVDGQVEPATPDAIRAYIVIADRVGVTLTYRYDPTTRQLVYRMTTGSARDLLNRRAPIERGVQA